MSRSVRFMTGHFRNNEPLDINWQHVADPDCTLVIYMGMANLDYISTQLILAGLPASTPAAAIENGTTSRQLRVLSQLDQLADDVKQASLKAPVMIIIGEVVSLAEELDWFQAELEKSGYDENTRIPA